MPNYKDFIKKNPASIVIITFLIICVLLTLFYVFFQNTQLNSTSEAGQKSPISFLFSPTSVNAVANASYSTDVIAKVNTSMNVQGYTFSLNFDITKVQITSISFVTGTPCLGLSDTNDTLANVNTSGSLKICSEAQSATGIQIPSNTNNKLVTLQFTTLDTNQSQISFNTSADNALFQIDANNFIVKQKAGSLTPLSIKKATGKR